MKGCFGKSHGSSLELKMNVFSKMLAVVELGEVSEYSLYWSCIFSGKEELFLYTNFRIRGKGREGERRRKTRMDSKATENRT